MEPRTDAWKLRDAGIDDLPALLTLFDELERAQGAYRIFPLREDAHEVAERYLREAIEHEDARVVVAESDGELIAMASMWYWVSGNSLDPMPVIDLSRVVVLKAWRGAGIGRALLEEAQAFGRARGARYLQAHMFSGNEDGRRFWERHGFVPRYEARVSPILPLDA